VASSGKPADAGSGSTAAASAAAFLDEARAKIKANDNPGAIISLRAVSNLAGCPPELRLEACKLLAQIGDNTGAIDCYLQVGDSYLSGRDFFRARQAFQAAHALDAHNLDIVFKLGQADAAEGRTQDGLAKFIDVLRKSNLRHVPALFEAGCIYQTNGQFDQAMLAFKKVLDRDRNHVQASLHIGQLYQSKENMPEAIAHYIQAAQIATECQRWGSARQIAKMVLTLDAANQSAKVILADLEEQGHSADEDEGEPIVALPAAPATGAQAGPKAAGVQPSRPVAPASAPGSSGKPVPAPAQPAATKPTTAAPTPAASSAPARPVTPQAPTKVSPPEAQPSSPAVPPSAAQPATPVTPAAASARAEAAKPVAPAAPAVSAASATSATPTAPAAPAAPAAPVAPTAAAASAARPAAPQTESGDVSRARQALTAIEMQRKAVQADLELLLATRDELQKALADQRAVLEKAAAREKELDAQITAAQARAAQAAQELEATRTAQGAQAAQAERAAKDAAAETERAANQAAAQARAAAQADREAIAALEEQRRELESDVEQLRTESAERLVENAGAQRAAVELTSTRDALSAEVEALTLKMQDAKRLTDELELARQAASKAEVLNAQVADLEAKRTELEARRAQIEAEVGAGEMRRARLEAEANAAETRRTQLEAATNAAETRRAQLDADVSAAETQVKERAAVSSRAAQEAETLRDQRRSEAEALMEKIETLRASLAELDQRMLAPPQPLSPAAHANVGPQGAHARAAMHLAAGEYEKAIAAYKQALEANPQDASAAYQAGALLAEGGGDLRVAEELLSRAAELRPEHAATRYQLAVVRARRGKVVEGVELLTALVRADSNNGDFIDQFIERLEKDSANGNVSARYKLGVAYRELGRIEEALVTLQAIQHEADYVVPCLIAIGLCLRRQGLDGAAAKRFAKAVETTGSTEPVYLEALYNLGDLYEAKGTQESLTLALSSFEEVYARDCTYRDIAERVRVVKMNLGSAERTKIKRLPTRMADTQGNP